MAERQDPDQGGGERLERYRARRDFERTPEPAGDQPEEPAGRRFVVQEHHATALHWDLRLERDGVLVSWAVPKGIPPDPRENHLAVHTEDHPLSYLDFHGEIPKGEYGGGRMTVWDRGTYECEKWEDREVMVTFSGQRVRGRYVLFHTSGNQWMIHRRDPPDDPDRQPMPERIAPAPLARGELPGDEAAWSFEPAWGGHRVVVAIDGARARAVDEAGNEVAGRYPELRDLGRAVGAVTVAIEGELVVT
ncbi:MAG: DNA polymerase ligase N-terminal domain-containing protein, partial [Acidimicrobiales bacterium]